MAFVEILITVIDMNARVTPAGQALDAMSVREILQLIFIYINPSEDPHGKTMKNENKYTKALVIIS